MTFASIVWDVDPVLVHLGSLEIRWYGLMWGLGFILAYEMVSRLFKKEGYPENWADKLFVYCIVSSVIGARLGHCLFYEWDYYGARRCICLDTGFNLVFQDSDEKKRVVAVRSYDTCRSGGLYVYPFR
jgi:prolipoprotein diacylglyceryltransferase